MNSIIRSVSSCAALLTLAGLASAAPLTPGNLITARVGAQGGTTLTSAAQAVILDEYNISTGVLVQSIALPTAPSGNNKAFALSGTATSEGFFNFSRDGQYLTIGGYAAAPGTAAIAGTTSANNPRVIARVDAATNVIDTTTALSDAYSANNIRSVTTDDGTAFWTGGTATGSAGGVRYALLGGATSVNLNAPTLPTNTRVVNIFNGQLYTSSSSGAFLGVSTVGTGLPTATGTAITALPGFPTTATTPSQSAYDYVIIPGNDRTGQTIYVADDRTNGLGGIQKWVLTSGTYTLAYTITLTTSSTTSLPVRSVTLLGSSANGNQLAVLTGETTQRIILINDPGTLAGVTNSTLTTAADVATKFFSRGLRVVPSRAVPCTPVTLDPAAPANQSNVPEGSTLSLTASITAGTAPITVAWTFNGFPINNGVTSLGTVSGATTANLQIAGVTAAAAGQYQARAFNACTPNGAVSNAATVTIAPSTPACLADINLDGTVDGGDFVAFINSFAIGDVSIDPAADVNLDGTIDGGDFVAFINAFALGC